MDDEVLTFEVIGEDEDREFEEARKVVIIYEEEDGRYSFASKKNPFETAKVISGLLTHILERDIG